MGQISSISPLQLVDNTNQYGGLSYPLFNVSEEVIGGEWFHRGRLDLKREIVLGFDPGDFHAYLSCGDLEFHPGYGISRAELGGASDDSIRAEVFLRIQGLCSNELEYLKFYMLTQKGKRSISSHIGVMELLEAGIGVGLSSQAIFYKFSVAELLFDILQNGLVDSEGRQLRVSLFTTSDKSLHEIIEEMKKVDSKLTVFNLVNRAIYELLTLFNPKNIIS